MTALSGSYQLLENLLLLELGLKKLAYGAVAEAAEHSAKQMRQGLTHKSVRDSMGWRFVRDAESVAAAKIGVSVGDGGSHISTRRGARGGVGISVMNVHWLVLGTAERWTGTERTRTGRKDTGGVKRYTGRMPAQERPLSQIFNARGATQVLTESFYRHLNDLVEELSV